MAGRRPDGYDVILTDHVFDKVRSIEMTLAEFEALLTAGEVIEEEPIEEGVKEVVLILGWTRPPHVVLVVDDIREEERIVTAYEPDQDRWSPDLRLRRR